MMQKSLARVYVWPCVDLQDVSCGDPQGHSVDFWFKQKRKWILVPKSFNRIVRGCRTCGVWEYKERKAVRVHVKVPTVAGDFWRKVHNSPRA
jgi:hypothetical protein